MYEELHRGTGYGRTKILKEFALVDFHCLNTHLCQVQSVVQNIMHCL